MINVLARLDRGNRPLLSDAMWARRHFDPARYGLPGREELDTSRGGPELPAYEIKAMQAIAAAAYEGDWRPGAEYVEDAGQDWDTRWSRMELLQAIARESDAWVESWRAARPESCDAATLQASRMVHQAWEIRGSGYAREIPADRMARFRAMLPAAIEAAQQAATLAPQNPGPWVVTVTAARGARYTPDQFALLWTELVSRAPHHYEGHWQALQFWCAKWAGSDMQMLAFAERAVDHAPPGSPLAAMYLYALRELETRNGVLQLAAGQRAMLQKVATSLQTVPADDERLPRLRHLQAYYLVRAGLHDAALQQFRLIGRWMGAEPWASMYGSVQAFDLARAKSARRARNPYPDGDTVRAARNSDERRRAPNTHW